MSNIIVVAERREQELLRQAAVLIDTDPRMALAADEEAKKVGIFRKAISWLKNALKTAGEAGDKIFKYVFHKINTMNSREWLKLAVYAFGLAITLMISMVTVAIVGGEISHKGEFDPEKFMSVATAIINGKTCRALCRVVEVSVGVGGLAVTGAVVAWLRNMGKKKPTKQDAAKGRALSKQLEQDIKSAA